MASFVFPDFTCGDDWLTRVYAYRCETFLKHVRLTPEGYVVTEFLPDVPWAGAYNTIPCAAAFHLREARWLSDPRVAADYLAFWCAHQQESRKYSFPPAHTAYLVRQATGDTAAAAHYRDFAVNFNGWIREHATRAELFVQTCDADGMEYAASGDGARPTINSYMAAESRALAYWARLCGFAREADAYERFALTVKRNLNERLYDPADGFYHTRRADGVLDDAKELIGFVPFAYGVGLPGREGGFEELWKPDGFFGAFGPTTLVRRDSRFGAAFPHECLWNGPSWPFATSQTLQALIACEQDPAFQVRPGGFMRLLTLYANGQRQNGEPYIDENLDADTGAWIARDVLYQWGRGDKDRGRHYNHSAFVDLIVTGLAGLMPADDEVLRVHPLAGTLPFELRGVPYHGHEISVCSNGHTFTVTADGRTLGTNAPGETLCAAL